MLEMSSFHTVVLRSDKDRGSGDGDGGVGGLAVGLLC